MPKRTYTPEERKLARRLLILHGGDVPIVSQLTSIPKRTLYRWRTAWDDDYQLYLDTMAQKIINHANAKHHQQSTPSPDITDDETMAQPQNSLAQYTHLRQTLMEHATTLADNLMLGDGYVNQRVYALSRLLDRIIQLDTIIPKENPERTIRFEFVSGGKTYDTPPWLDTSENDLTQDNYD